MNLVDLVALTLAIGGLVDCWMNGSVFEEKRRQLAGWKVLACDYCMNWQAPFWLILFFYLPGLWLPSPWDVVDRLPIYWLAAAYAAWLINEVRAVRENDYRRTVRAEEDMAKYGGRAGAVAEVEGETHGGMEVREVPAVSFDDGRESLYYCSTGCRVLDWNQAKDWGTLSRATTGAVVAGAKCHRCGKPLL